MDWMNQNDASNATNNTDKVAIFERKIPFAFYQLPKTKFCMDLIHNYMYNRARFFICFIIIEKLIQLCRFN